MSIFAISSHKYTITLYNPGHLEIIWELFAKKSADSIFLISAPILTVMDGFGRELLDQYYKVGSSLEVMCQVDRLPARPLPDIIEWRHGSSKLPKSNSTSGQRYVIIPY